MATVASPAPAPWRIPREVYAWGIVVILIVVIFFIVKDNGKLKSVNDKLTAQLVLNNITPAFNKDSENFKEAKPKPPQQSTDSFEAAGDKFFS
jgi:uncharacterized membrane protein